MKKILINLFCFGLLGSQTIFAMPLADDYSKYAATIMAGNSQGTGFFLQASNSVYLVTARHVLFNNRQNSTNWTLWSANAKIIAHSSESNLVVLKLDLDLLLNSNEVRYSTNHDVAIVRVENCNPTNAFHVFNVPGVIFESTNRVLAPMSASLCRKFDDTAVGLDIFIFGFPSSLGIANLAQIDSSLPLLRKGIIAGKNQSRRVFVIDCASYQGNSGGPAIGKESERLGTTDFPLLGVVVEMIPYSESWINSRLGYWPDASLSWRKTAFPTAARICFTTLEMVT